MAVFLLLDGRDDEFRQLVTRGPGAQQAFDIVLNSRKEAGADMPVSRQPNAAAMAAERLGDGIDESDLARRAISEAVASRRLAQIFTLDRHERVDLIDPLP